VPNEGAADVVTPLLASIESAFPFDAGDPCTVSSVCIICISLYPRSLGCPSASLLLEESTCTFDASVREWIDSDRRTRNAACLSKKFAKKMPAYFAYFRMPTWHPNKSIRRKNKIQPEKARVGAAGFGPDWFVVNGHEVI
jgi:hypothetical protein